MTNERLQEIFDSCANDDPDVHLIYGRAVALAATLAEKRQPQWLPIETAAKDGTPILVTNGDKSAAVFWWPAVWMGTTHNGMKNPTHWMPLPAPPQGKA